MPVCRVDTQHIDAYFDQGFGALDEITTHADGRAYPQSPLLIFTRIRVFDLLHDIFDRNHPRQAPVVVHHQHLFDAVFVEQFFGLFERCPFGHRHQVFAGHEFANRAGAVGFEAQIAVGDNPHQIAIGGGDGDARNAVIGHHVEGIADCAIVLHGDRVGNHAVFGAFDFARHFHLVGNRQVFVDDTHAPFAGHGNRQAVLGDGIHGGTDQGYIHANPPCQPGTDIGCRRQHVGCCRDEEYVVERQAFAGKFVIPIDCHNRLPDVYVHCQKCSSHDT